MKLRETLARPFKVIYEALSGTAVGSYAGDEDYERETGFRPLSDRLSPNMRRDLSPMSHEQMLKMAHYLSTSNPLAKFLINIPTAVCIGRRLEYALEIDHETLGASKDQADAIIARAKPYLDAWWRHPAHDFASRALKYARTYQITGELPLMVTEVNPVTGLFQLDYIDSSLIKDVERLNGLSCVPGALLIQAQQVGAKPKRYEVSREGDFKGAESMLFFFSAERLNSMRGFSYLLDVGDWIDSYDQSFFGQVDKFILGNTLVHDLEIKGADQATLKTQTDAFRAASGKPGGVFAHNENVKHEVKTPDLASADGTDFQRQMRLHVIGSKGIPEHWYGSGENSNRSTADAQNEVSLKVMEALQEELSAPFRTALNIAWDQLAQFQGLPSREQGVSIYPVLPKISEADITKMGAVFAQTEAALDAAVDSGRLSTKTGRKVTATIYRKLTGQALDSEEESALIDAEAEERAERAKDAMEKGAQASADRLAAAVHDEEPRLRPSPTSTTA